MTNIVSDLYGPDPHLWLSNLTTVLKINLRIKTGLTLVTDETYKLMSQVVLKKLYVAYSI